MRRGALWSCVVCLGFTASARADEPFLMLDGFNGFWGSPGVPDAAFQRLKALQTGNRDELKCVAFTPQGDWVVLFGGNGFWTSNGNLPACKKLKELQQKGRDLKCVAFAPAGGWAVLWDQNGHWTEGNVPEVASKKLQDIASRGGALRSIAFGPDGGWVILFDGTGVWHGGVPHGLARVLDGATRNRLTVVCVAFTGKNWVCLTERGWWASDPAIAPSKAVARAYRQNRLPRWIAARPTLGEPEFAKWSELMHGAYDGKLAGGYAFQVFHHGKLMAEGAEGWARLPSEPRDPSVRWTRDTVMGVASVSKTVTAVALLKLWEEKGRSFSLDDPFWPHVRRVFPTAAADVKRVTIRQVLAHRSGFAKSGGYITPLDLQKLLDRPLAHPPGTFHEYQNNNFALVHHLIEQIGHVEYTPYVRGHVLAPMGITHMETHSESTRPTCAYGLLDDRGPGDPFAQDCASWAGPAGWYASASDLGRFLIGLRDRKVLNAATSDVLWKECFGWDSSEPGWTKGGFWPAGDRELRCQIAHFPDDIDAVVLLNCHDPRPNDNMLVEIWTQARDRR